MKLKILGKYGPYGKAGEGAASGYYVTDENFGMIFDMGSGVLSRALKETDFTDIDGIFISHLHYDHTSDLLPLRYLLEEKGTKIKIFTEKQSGPWYDILFSHPLFEVINIAEDSVFEIKGKKISFYRMKHPIPDLGIKIEGNGVFAYTGDTVYNENLKPLLDGCSVAVADCSKPAGFVGGHMTVREAVRLKEETDVKLLIASHASPDYDPSEAFGNIDGLVSAEEGKIYAI